MKKTKNKQHLINKMTTIKQKNSNRNGKNEQNIRPATFTEQVNENIRRDLEILLKLDHKL